MTPETSYRKTLKWLRDTFPAVLDVRLVPDLRVNGQRVAAIHDGTTAPREVRISKKQPWAIRIDSLIHEWAHEMTVLGARCSEKCDDHCAHWGKWYAQIYQAWCDWNYGRPA